jgi:hypothetical protein
MSFQDKLVGVDEDGDFYTENYKKYYSATDVIDLMNELQDKVLEYKQFIINGVEFGYIEVPCKTDSGYDLIMGVIDG